MEIFKDTITQLVRRGYPTSQVPSIAIDSPNLPVEIVPDSWLYLMSFTYGIVVGKQTGFLHLSPEGFVANFDQIEKAWQDATSENLNRGDFTECITKIIKDYRDTVKYAERALKKGRVAPKHSVELIPKLEVFKKQLDSAMVFLKTKGFNIK